MIKTRIGYALGVVALALLQNLPMSARAGGEPVAPAPAGPESAAPVPARPGSAVPVPAGLESAAPVPARPEAVEPVPAGPESAEPTQVGPEPVEPEPNGPARVEPVHVDPLSVPFTGLQGPQPLLEFSTGSLRDVLQDPSPNVEFDRLPQQPHPASSGVGAMFPVGEGIQLETAFGGRLALSPPGAAEPTGKLPGPELTGFGLALKLAAGKQWQLSFGYRREQSPYAYDGAGLPQSGPLQDTIFFGIWHAF